MLQVVQAGGCLQQTSITADLMQSWIGFLDASPKTVATYTRAIRQFGKYLQSNHITEPRREDLLSYRQSMIDDGKAAATIKSYMTAVKLFFAWLAEKGLYPNIGEHVKTAKVQQYYHKDYLTTRQARALIGACNQDTESGARDYALIRLMATAGLRTIEVIRADVEDLGTVGDDAVLYIQGKGRDDKSEYVKLSPEVEDAIRRYLAIRGENQGPLFTSTAHRNQGQRMTTRSVSRIVKNHLQEVGLNSKRLTAHSLRHTAAHAMIKAGETLDNVQRVLRHSNISTTMIYLAEQAREANNGELAADAYLFGTGE